MKLQFIGRGQLLENGQYILPGERFDATDQRAAELLANPHASVQIAQGEYSHLTRDELNQLAEKAGVSDPESLPNKQAVVDCLMDPEHEAEADSGEGHFTHSPEED